MSTVDATNRAAATHQNAENQRLLGELERLSAEVCEKRREYPQILANSLRENYELRLRRLATATIASHVIDRKMDVEKIINEITTSKGDSDKLRRENEWLREENEKLKTEAAQLRQYRMALYNALTGDTYSRIL